MTTHAESVLNAQNLADTRVAVASITRSKLAQARIRQSVVADALDISQQAVSRRLSGHVPFSAHELLVVADLLGISPGALLDGTAS